MRRMTTLVAIVLVGLAGPGLAGTGSADEPDQKQTTTTWTNDQGVEVKGNWTSGTIIEIETVEDYYWHRDHYDPAAHYIIAPWIHDPFNLAAESGGDNDRN